MKKLSIALTTLILLSFSSLTQAAKVPIYESVNSVNITNGITHENIVRFTDDGWLNINVVKADVSNNYLNFAPLVNKNSMQELTGTDDLVISQGAVAGVNGGFFNWSKIPGLASPIGPIVGDSKVLSSSSDFNKYSESMATFYVNNINQTFVEYWKSDISIYTASGERIPVERYNVQLNNNGDLTVMTRDWGETSFGLPDSNSPFYSIYTQVVEMVVRKGMVVEIRENKSAVEIPEDGYIIVAANSKKDVLLNKFKIGDTVVLDIQTTPNHENISAAITGGAIILKDGSVPTSFSHDIPGRNPRTALGYSKDGKTIYMVTVDGRQQSSIGMTLTELAGFMSEIGAYTAVNLDGGGSTTLALRKPGTKIIDIVNSPSDGMARRVANAFGIFSNAPKGDLAGLIIDTDETFMFSGTRKSFSIRAYDSYGNPFEIDPNSVQWSVKGINGSFDKNTFFTDSKGRAVISASIGNVREDLEINVLGLPSILVLNTDLFSINSGKTRRLTVKGIDPSGFSAYIPAQDIDWSTAGNIGIIENGVFHAENPGMGYVEADFKGVKAYCGISVFSDAITVVDNFEDLNGTYLSYPADIPGKYELTNKSKISGNYSGRLTYDFTDSKGSRASYMVFSEDGIPIAQDVNRIGVWVYNEKENPNWIRALVSDEEGQRHYLDLSSNLDFTGWKYLEASIPDIDKGKLTLLRLYIVQIRDIPDKGEILFDDLTFVSLPPQDELIIDVPEDTSFEDLDKRSVDIISGSDSFTFGVFGNTKDPVNPLENLLLQRLLYKFRDMEISAFIGEYSIDKNNMFRDSFIKTYIDLISKDFKNSRFIQLDTRKSGMRSSNKTQWTWFKNRLDTFEGDNVFIFTLNHPDEFSDKLEASLFKKTLSEYVEKTGRNIWVFYDSEGDFPVMENSVKYLYAGGLVKTNMIPERAHLINYIKVSVDKSNVTYEVLPVLP